ncbi:MAG: hypothetical protein KF851_13495 [Pirellulaceae bacterium]|nr:hypothetical protein [Pirellulaceae bacterium]
MNKLERKTNFVDSNVQGSLILRICLHWLGFLILTGSCFIFLQALLADPQIPFWERMQKTTTEFALLGVLMLAILPAFMLDSVRFSNRFVGPIFRLRRALRELKEHGHCETIKFRDHDFWQEIAEDFNAVANQVMERNSQAQSEPSAERAEEVPA